MNSILEFQDSLPKISPSPNTYKYIFIAFITRKVGWGAFQRWLKNCSLSIFRAVEVSNQGAGVSFADYSVVPKRERG